MHGKLGLKPGFSFASFSLGVYWAGAWIWCLLEDLRRLPLITPAFGLLVSRLVCTTVSRDN